MPLKSRELAVADIYFDIDSTDLIPGTMLPCDVYSSNGGLISCLFMRGTIFTGKIQDIIRMRELSGLYVKSGDSALLQEYISRGGLGPAPAETHAGAKVPAYDPKEFFQVDHRALIPHSEIPFNLYIRKKEDITLLIESAEVRPAHVTEMFTAAKGDILIKKSDMFRYRNYLKQNIVELNSVTKRVESKVKAVILRENSKLVVQQIFENPRSEELIAASREEVNGIADAILDDKDVLYDLIEIRNYDFYTYTHSVNVAVLSIGLDIRSGLSRGTVENLGIGALLHDIGKSSIPEDIMQKPWRLDELEFSITKTHVDEGEKILRSHRIVPAESFCALLEHHEKLSGTGYPKGLAGNDISLFGRITAIVDAYDALTTGRPYKTALTPFYALSLLKHEHHDYDRDILRVFIRMLGRVR